MIDHKDLISRVKLKCEKYGTSFFKYIFVDFYSRVVENNVKYRKWNESGFRPPLCTYRLNWARRTSEDGEMIEMTLSSRHRIRKLSPGGLGAEHATYRSRRLHTIPTFTRGWGRNIFCCFQTAETGNRTPNSGVKGSGANHYLRAPALRVKLSITKSWFLGSSWNVKST